MKKKSLVIFIIILFLSWSFPVIYGDSSAEDYKVIKKAVKGKKKIKDLSFFKILVVDNYTKKVEVKITLPISLIDIISDCSDGIFEISHDCRINLKKILRELKKHGPFTLIEVCDDEATVKIWFE